jgi:hypothetical membrane protein
MVREVPSRQLREQKPAGPGGRAFPNAYLEVDEPSNTAFREKVFALAGLVGLAYFGLTVILFLFEPTGFDPVRQTVSDYAVGWLGAGMTLGFFVGGAGAVSLGLALLTGRMEGRAFRAGSVLLLASGLALFAVGAFPTDIEGAPATFHGMVHNVLSLLVFTLGPLATILISYAHGRRWLSVALSGFVAAAVVLATVGVLGLAANGLAQRFLIAVLFGSWIYLSYNKFSNPSGP